MTRTRSSASPEGDADSATNHQEGMPGGSEPHVSTEGDSAPQGSKPQ